MPRDPAAEKAAQELLDAVRQGPRRRRRSRRGQEGRRRQRRFPRPRRASDTAEKNLDSVREGLKKADLEAIAVLCARNAAAAALRHRPRLRSMRCWRLPRTVDGIAKVNIEAGSETTRIAAKATNEVLTLIAEAPESRSAAGPKRDVSPAGMAANRADGAAAAAESSIAAAEAGNGRAARINAAVAGVDAAGAAVAAAKVAADFTGAKLPPVVSEIEEANANAHISIFWQVIPYILTTMAEVCISVVGLELAFAAAPPALKTFMTACWLFTIFFANIINAQVSPLVQRHLPGHQPDARLVLPLVRRGDGPGHAGLRVRVPPLQPAGKRMSLRTDPSVRPGPFPGAVGPRLLTIIDAARSTEHSLP